MGYEADGKAAAAKLISAWEKLKSDVDKLTIETAQLKQEVNDLKNKSHTHP